MGKFRISTPASSAGIMRFTDVRVGGLQIEPQHVLLFAVIVIVGVSILRVILG